MDRRVVVGISGGTSSGKTTVAEMLAETHYGRVGFRDVLAALLRADGIDPTRSALRELGLKVHREQGQRWLDERVLEQADVFGTRRSLVIDGLRFPEDLDFFRAHYGSAFLHVHVIATEATRLARFVARGGSEQEFEYALSHPTESYVEHLTRLAEIAISNDGTLDALREDVLSLTVDEIEETN